MPEIFISHANIDKGRILPYILYILAKTSQDVKFWIDRPEGIHPNLGRLSRIKAIVPGSDWRDSILQACKASQVVLALWSLRVEEKDRAVMNQEITIGTMAGKCIVAAIDPFDQSLANSIIHNHQVLDIHRFGIGLDDAQFDRVIDTAVELIEKFQRNGSGAELTEGPGQSTPRIHPTRTIAIGIMGGDYVEGKKEINK